MNPVSSTHSLGAVISANASLGIKLANQLKPIIIPPPVKEVIFKNERRLLFVDIFSMRFYFIDEHFLLRIVLLVLFLHKFRNGKYFHSLQFQFLHR